MKLIFGLGNPGEEYKDTRHNIGFLFIDRLSELYKISLEIYEYQTLIGEGSIEKEKIILAKPLCFVNEAGKPLYELKQNYEVKDQDIIVISDDVDLERGRIRITSKGGDGGHKGLRSIIQYLGTSNIPRIRIGIGRPEEKMDLRNYVLGNFTFEEKKIIKESIDRATRAIKVIVLEGIEEAMREFNAFNLKKFGSRNL